MDMNLTIEYELRNQRPRSVGHCIDALMRARFRYSYKLGAGGAYSRKGTNVAVLPNKISILLPHSLIQDETQPVAGEILTTDQREALRIMLKYISPLRILDELGNEINPETLGQ